MRRGRGRRGPGCPSRGGTRRAATGGGRRRGGAAGIEQGQQARGGAGSGHLLLPFI
jgi:hypothetical protein